MATIYLERIHLKMDDDFDDDGDSLVPNGESFNKNLSAAPELSIQKPTFRKKISKVPSRLMSNKGLIKINESNANLVFQLQFRD